MSLRAKGFNVTLTVVAVVVLIAMGIVVIALVQSPSSVPPIVEPPLRPQISEVDDSGVVRSLTGSVIEIGLVQYPGSFADKDGEHEGLGLVAEITSAAFAEVGIEVEYAVLPLPRAAKMMSSGEYKAILGATSWLDKRAKFHYVKLFAGPLVIFYMRDKYPQAIAFDTLDDLRGYKIGALRGSVAADKLKDDQFDLIPVNTIESGLKMLHSGRVDLMPLGETSARIVIDRLFPGQKEQFMTLEKPLSFVSVGLIVNENERSLAELFYKGLETIVSTGLYKQIVEEHNASLLINSAPSPD